LLENEKEVTNQFIIALKQMFFQKISVEYNC
jgi:hypothetical protein